MKTVQCVKAQDMPKDVKEWCVENDISTHYSSELHQVEDDGNPFAEWLKTLGFKFDHDTWGWVGVWGT